MGLRGPRYESALIKAAQGGTARICAAFGGQGPSNLNCFNDLVELKKTHGSRLSTLIQTAASTLSELASLPHRSGFHEDLGFDIEAWLADPASAPGREYLALAPISFPINTLLSLAHYCVTCRALEKDPGQLRSSLHSVVGHSQGLFAAAAVAKSDSWHTFYEACDMALQISFWVGLESHHAAPPSRISAAAARDCIDHGEGQPSSMLSISGLNRSQIVLMVDKVNRSLAEKEDLVHLALVNSRDKFVLAGPPQSLRAVCVQLREIKAAETLDQTRILFHKRKPKVDVHFLPISAPYHSVYLNQVDTCMAEALSSMSLSGNDLGIPLYHTHNGKNLQEWQSEDVLRVLIRAVTVDMVDWVKICRNLDATHLLDFGPGQIGGLTNETTEGAGLRVIQMTDRSSSSKNIGVRAEVFSEDMPPAPPNWKQMFGPRLLASEQGVVRLETKMTRVFGTPPVMIAGMTPTTVPWDFVATVMQAGYHIELAGGGYSEKKKFETAIRKLASTIPADRGITCNLLYANPKTIAWQTSLLRDLVSDGIPIAGITIGAGIPSPDVVKEYIQSIGLKHISFKPGSYASIDQVIAIAQQYPDFPIGLQWTGGRAGGHHSSEDFHSPILKTYGRIRKCPNILLIAGSGFGGGLDTFPYITGEWSHSFGYPSMPFDGVLLGSRMMVAKEAHTSIQAKQLIIEAEGVSDTNWHKTSDQPTGGVITITSEMGQPIHMLATRGVMLWKEFDQRIFSIRDAAQRLKYLRSHRDEIVSRLNKEFARPWFAVNGVGQNVEIEQMTYLEVLRRLCQLMYVHHQNRWIDPSYQILVRDFLHLARERFGHRIDSTGERPSDIVSAFEEAVGSDANETLYPEDVALLMALLRRRNQKPVPFIPRLDENFETWFKKDSLWQAEDIEAVIGQDVQRVCVIHGPVAAQYSTSCDESAKDILDNICQQHIQMLQQNVDSQPRADFEPIVRKETTLSAFHDIKVINDRLTRKYELFKGDRLPETDMLIEHIIGPTNSWARSCLMDRWVFKGTGRVENPIRAAFRPQPGDVVEVRLTKNSIPQEITLNPGALNGKSSLQTVLKIASNDGRSVTATVAPPALLCAKRPRVEFAFELRQGTEGCTLHERTSDKIERVKALYAHLWTGSPSNSLQIAGLNSEFSGEDRVLSQQEVQEYVSVVGQTSPPQLRAWSPGGSVPLDYCIVVAWTALTKPLMIPALNCDLLRLLHRSISFKYVPSARPLEVGDVVRTVSRITALTIQPTGKLIEVSADIRRHGEPVITMKSDFFVQGKFTDFEKQFKSFEEPEMVVDVESEVLCALLISRKWLILENLSADLIGKTLIFRLTTHTMFNHEGHIALLQVAGTVSIAGHDASPTRLGQVYFEEDSCLGNPVMDFLRRHGARRVNRQALENPGWTDSSTMFVRAPSRSAPYAKVSHDTNPIHVCPVFARYAGLPGTVVHGMQTSAIVRRTIEWTVGDTDRSRFKRWHVAFEGMVRPNDLLRIELQHIAMEEGRMVFKVQAFNDQSGDKVVEAEAEVEQQRTGYVFCGQGSQEKGMGMSLYATRPEAKAVWNRGDDYLREHYGTDTLK
jgi:fatty acid synthase subunit beta, fungi type